MTEIRTTPNRRRALALLLIPCLFALGILAAVAPLREADSESGTVRAQALRAPELRQAQTAPFSPVAFVSTGPMSIPETTSATDDPLEPLAVAPRNHARPTHHSRAPPTSL